MKKLEMLPSISSLDNDYCKIIIKQQNFTEYEISYLIFTWVNKATAEYTSIRG